MSQRSSDFLNGYQQDNGSKQHTLNSMRPVAERRGYTGVVDYIDAALSDCEAVQGVNFRWRQFKASGPISRTGAVELDVKLDRTLSQFHTIVDAYANSQTESPQRQAARRIKEGVIPRGVYPITSLKYEEEHAEVDELHKQLTTDFADDVEAVALKGVVDDIGQINSAFGDELKKYDAPITYDDVLDARRASEESYSRAIMSGVVATFDDPEARDELLSAYFDQQQRIAAYRKRRGSLPRVDPDTGEFVEEDEPQAGGGGAEPQPVVDADEPAVEPVPVVEE